MQEKRRMMNNFKIKPINTKYKNCIILFFMLLSVAVSYADKTQTTPIEITSDTLDIDYKIKKSFFKGHVKAVDGTMTLTSDKMLVSFSQNDKINTINAENNVVVYYKDKLAHCGKAVYFAEQSFIELTENPILEDSQNKLTDAKIIKIFRNEEKLFAEGGIHLIIYPNSLNSNKKDVSNKEKTKKHLPIDIEAEQVNIDYNKRIAIFNTNVKVVDGTLLLNAEKLTVLFDEKNKLKEIKAEDQVVVLKDDKRAEAGLAVYTVANGVIRLSEKPVLFQENNKLVGAKAIVLHKNEETVQTEGRTKLIFYNNKKENIDE